MERPSLLSPLNGDEKRLTTVPQRTVSLLCETDAKQASVQLLKRQALGVWHADALSDVENAIGDLHFWPTTWSKDPRSRDYDMQRLGRSKRLDNRERFELFRFVVGNGASPALAVELLAASESLPDTFAITQMENLVKKAAEGSFARDAFSSRQRRSDHANQVCPRRRRIVWARSFDSPHRIAHS